ncbi:MAG: hypothetical protein ACPG6B_10095 [Oceanihabitans sp.]
MLYIKFNIQDQQKYKDFKKVYEHMAKVRQPNFEFEDEKEPTFDWGNLTEEETNAALEKIDEFLDIDAEDRRYKELFPDYADANLKAYIKSDKEIAGAYGFDIKGIFNYLEYSFEVDVNNLQKLNETSGLVAFSTGNYPFGGLERFIMTLKAFNLIPFECFDGFTIFEFNWTSTFQYQTVELLEKTETYKKTKTII